MKSTESLSVACFSESEGTEQMRQTGSDLSPQDSLEWKHCDLFCFPHLGGIKEANTGETKSSNIYSCLCKTLWIALCFLSSSKNLCSVCHSCTWGCEGDVGRWRRSMWGDGADAELLDVCGDLDGAVVQVWTTRLVLLLLLAQEDPVLLQLAAVVCWRRSLRKKSVHHFTNLGIFWPFSWFEVVERINTTRCVSLLHLNLQLETLETAKLSPCDSLHVKTCCLNPTQT